MEFTVFATLTGKILASLTAITAIASTLLTWVIPLVLLGLTIKIAWFGFNLIRGTGGNYWVLDLFAESSRTFIVYSLALAGAAYSTNVVGFLMGLRTQLTGLVSKTPAVSSHAAMDAAMSQLLGVYKDILSLSMTNISILPKFDMTGMISLMCATFMVLCLFIYAIVSVVNLLVIDCSLSLFFGLGPLFIACFAFESTAKFFDSWLAGVIKYIFTGVVIAFVIGVGNEILFEYMSKLGKADISMIDIVSTSLAAMASSGVLIVLALKAPDLAADLVGSQGLQVVGPAKAAKAAAEKSTAASAAARGAATSAAVGGASRVGSAIAGSAIGQRVAGAYQRMRGGGGGAAAGAGTESITASRPVRGPRR